MHFEYHEEKYTKARNWPKIFLQVIKHVIKLLINKINRIITVTPWFFGAENSRVTSGFVEVFGALGTTKDEF